jgi:hypothetical protein
MRVVMAAGLALPLVPEGAGATAGSSTVASSTAASSGGLSFAGTAALPTFPCPAPSPGQFACVGTFTASTAGSASGVDGDSPWYVAVSATTNGTFSYADSVQPGVPCVEGAARGTAALDTAVTGQAFGTYMDGNLARAVRSAAISYSFSWDRVGVTAVLDMTDVAIQLDVEGLGLVSVLLGGTATAVASFIPHPDSPPPSGCATGPPTELHGSLAGTVSGIAVRP